MFFNKLIKAVAYLGGGAIAGQLVLLIAAPLLTRIYSPSDFGIYGSYVAVLYVVSVVASLQYEMAITIAKDERHAQQYLVLSCAAVVLFSFFLYLLVKLFRVSDAYYWVGYVPAGVLLLGLVNVFTNYRLRYFEYRIIAGSKLAQAVASTASQIFFGAVGVGAIGLIYGQMIGMFASVGVVFRKISVCDLNVSNEFKSRLMEEKNLAIYYAPATLINVLNTHAPVLFVGVFMSPAVAGVFALAQRIVSTPLAILSKAISGALASFVRDASDKEELVAYITLLKVSLLLSPVVLVTSLGCLYYLSTLFGEAWESGSRVAAYISLFVVGKFVYDSVFVTMLAKNNHRWSLLLNASIIFVRFFALVVGVSYFDYDISIGIFSFVSSCAYLSGLAVMVWLIDRRYLKYMLFSFLDIVLLYLVVVSVVYYGFSSLVFFVFALYLINIVVSLARLLPVSGVIN